MKINHIILVNQYLEGSAETNRILAYAQAFVDLGLSVSIVFHQNNEFEVKMGQGIVVYRIISNSYLLSYYKIVKVIKQIYTEQTAILEYSTSLLCAFLNRNKYNIFIEFTEIPMYGRPASIVQKIKELIKERLSSRARGVMVISNSLKKYYIDKKIRNLELINMFVDTRRFENVLIKQSTEKYVAYCGTIDESKDGVDVLLESFGLFHRQYPEFRLKIIGRVVNRRVLDKLEGIIDAFDIRDYVDFTGLLKATEIPSILCGASILALARPNNLQAQYGFPTKLGEYLCTGRPVVVTNVGEINYFLKDKETCIFAEADNSEDFALKLIWVADNYDEALKIGKRGKSLCEYEFSSRIQAEKALVFMNNCI